MSTLSRVLARVLEGQKDSRDIIEMEEMFGQLCRLADPVNESLKKFEEYLRSECGLATRVIYAIVDKLSLDAEFKAVLGKKILLLWLKYKIFEVLDIIKSSEQEKRAIVSKAIDNFSFGGSCIEKLLETCISAIEGDLEDLSQINNMVVEGKQSKEIDQLFIHDVPPPPTNDKSIEQKLNDYILDYKYIPDGSIEKILLRELIITFLTLHPQAKRLSIADQILELKDQANDIRTLQSTYLKQIGTISNEVQNIFKKLSSELTPLNVYENLLALKEKLLPIDVLELERLINKTNEARKQIEDKDVLFVIGTTGSGKSTNILKFLGYTLKAATYKGLSTLTPVQELANLHKTFHTSPQTKSCTRFINAAPIPQNFYRRGTRSDKKTLVICDSPGFGDNGGVQVDIANGVGMINAIHGSRTVRVIVLLAYDALTSSRLKGAVEIGDIISSLFHDITKAINSIAIYFNKVPQDKISEVPNLIANKLRNLNETEKANEKLVAFLELLLQKSHRMTNYIYPLESDYKNLFSLLEQMPPICQVRQNFRYDFTDLTKREINSFIASSKVKIKDYINNERLQKARFHFKMFEKLKNILSTHEKIREAFIEIAHFIKTVSVKYFKKFEQYLIDICNGEEDEKLSSNLVQSKNKVEAFETNFYDFEEIAPKGKQQIAKVIQEYKSKLLGESKKLESFNSKKICSAIRIFSKWLDPELENNVVEYINKQFNQTYKKTLDLIEENNYQDMVEHIKTLKATAGFIQYFSAQHSSQKMMEELKGRFNAEVDRHLEFITENILQESFPLTQRSVNLANERLRMIESIDTLKITEQSGCIAKRLNECIKKIINKCKMGIRELDKIDISITSGNNSPMIDKDYLKDLASKKAEIELLMKISNVGDVLRQDYEYTKENIGRRLIENVEILNNCINALKENKTNEIERDVNLIRRAAQMVLKCSQCVEQGENYKHLAESISVEFLNYLSLEMQTIKGIEIRVNQINQQSVKKIERQYKKNQTYTKMASIDPQIAQNVTQLKEQFRKILMTPLAQFQEKDVKLLREKKDYQRLNNSLQRFQKLCFYSLEIEQIISSQDCSEFISFADPIRSCMQQYLEKIRQESNNFCQKQSITEDKQYLKELIKILVAIAGKPSTCIYLSSKMDFEAISEIQKIKQQLFNIKSIIESKFSHYYESANRIDELTSLVKVCRFYSPAQRILKIKQQAVKLNFRQLEQKIHKCYFQNLNDDQDRAKSLISVNQPSKILWYEVKAIYSQFSQMRTADGNRKKGIITQNLWAVQKNILHELKSLDNKISNYPDIIIKDRQIMNELLEKFKEAIQIKKQLSLMYIKEDQHLIQISNRHLKDVGTNMIEIFKTQFDTVIKQLIDYNVTSIKQKINNFGGLENIIYSVFLQEDQEPNSEHKTNAENVRQFIDAKRTLLIDEIMKSKTIEDFQKKDIRQAKAINLKKLINILSKGINQQIQDKYDHFSDNFVIDNGFKKYYLNFLHPKEAANTEHKNHLVGNVKNYFNKLISDYKFSASADEQNKTERLIVSSMENLPPDLKQTINQLYFKSKLQIKTKKENMLQELSQKIISNPNEVDHYLAAAFKANENGQKQVYEKFIEKFDFVYTEKSRASTTMVQKILFINDYFIRVLERNQQIQHNKSDLAKKLVLKLDEQLKRLSNLVQAQLLNIKKFMENPTKAQEHHIDVRQSITDIFKAHQSIIDLGKDHAEVKGKIISSIEEKLIQVIQIYNQKMTTQPQENLSSIEILDNQKTKKLRTFIEYLINTGQLIETIKNELQKTSITQNRGNGNTGITARYMKMKGHKEIITFYQCQIKGMLEHAGEFQFYDLRKRSMSIKQLEADMLSIEHTVEILKQRNQFFNTLILTKKDSYEFRIVFENFPTKLRQLIMDAKIEIEEAFRDLNNDPASKINLIMNILRIMKEKKFKMIANSELEQNYKELSKLLKNNFDKVRQKCSQKIKIAYQKKVEVQKEIKIQQKSKKTEIDIIQNETQIKISTTTNQITKRFDERIASTDDADTKTNYEKGKRIELNSCKNGLNHQRQEQVKRIQEKYTKIINQLNQSLVQPLRQLAQTLALYKKVVLDINYDNQKTVAQFEAVLDEIPKDDAKFIKLIQQQLDTIPNDQFSLGKVLLTTNKIFSNFVTRQMAKLIKGKDINYVLDNLEKISLTKREPISKPQKQIVNKQFQFFKASYEEYKRLYTKNPQESTISLIATECKDLGTMLKNDFYQNEHPRTGNKMKLLSGIFAIWAIQKSQKIDEQVEYTMEPHPTQITTLILLLGLAHEGQKISNRLAQVGTGEGKSIVLAGLSSYLALCGFKVRCACYSAYLSGRDKSNFIQLFERLGIENDIKYGTFNQLCEDILNQGENNFKEEVQKMILEQPQAWWQRFASKFGSNLVTIKRGTNRLKQNPTILVIDEVDVFFDQNFFGSTYCPGIKLRDPIVTRFLEYVWTEVSKFGQDIEPSILIASQEFKQLVDRYPSLSKLLQNQVHGMIAGALSYKHDYFLIDKKLVYKDNDTISPNISYGYKTVFANIFEHYKGNVSRSNLDEALQISLMIAEFSYAMLPSYFDSILGVTGTLQVLPIYKKKLLKERYGIEDQYAIPSAFGLNKQRTDNYYIIPIESLHQTIIAKINEIQDKRPIIIFFKQSRDLNEFSQSPWYDSFMKRTYNLTEEHEQAVRDSRIIGAVNPHAITLMTNSFGRGTDFILLDKIIKAKGGLHVIHAFLSHDQSEEIQIKGRTARQSNSGSYDCIINESCLEELGLTASNIPRDANSETIHTILRKARDNKINNLSQTTLKLLEESDKKHENVVKIFTKQSLAQSDLIEYVSKLNFYPEIRKLNIKTVLGLDATGSMSDALKKTCEVIGTAFERAHLVLTDSQVKASIEIKIMVYRNYNSPFQEILETTAYENTPHNLHKFLERVSPKGGWRNEALEVFFQSLNKEEKIDLVILIGDAAPNTPNQVTTKRAAKGENYWNSNGYPATNIDTELDKFAQKKSPVHSFYLNAGTAFRNISNKTGGQASPFNLSSDKVADELTAFVVENVLKLIEAKAGKGNLNLVQTYRRMFI